VNTLPVHSVSAQRQVRLRHTSRTGGRARHVDQDDVTATVAADEDPAGQAAHRRGRRLHHHLNPAGLLGDLDDMESVQADEQIPAVAVGQIRT
jgi:hypothetical protein